jgi:uncharacterized protein
MQLAVNYSPLLAELVRAGQVELDLFKCPAWPALVEEARCLRPAYIHFPLSVGGGQGMPINEETHAPADLEQVADLLALSASPLVNTHFILDGAQYPDIPPDSRQPRHMQQVLSAAQRDLEPLIKRFGAERVIVENVINNWGWLTIGVLPEVIARLLEATGCGFLYDQSHARLAARNLGIDERAYSSALPVERIREVHITGLQVMEGDIVERVLAAGDPGGWVARMAGRLIDHLPMTAADWPELEWMAAQISSGTWQAPWTIASEVGGVGSFWELVIDRTTYLEQVPRMQQIIASATIQRENRA